MLTDEDIRATFHAWATPPLEGVYADHLSLIGTHRRLQTRHHRRTAALASMGAIAVAAASVTAATRLQGHARPGTEPSISLTAAPSPPLRSGGPTVRVMDHRLAFPAGWIVPPPTTVVESLRSHAPLVEDISPAVPGNAIHLDIRVFARHLAHTPDARVHSSYATREVSVTGHRVVIARAVTFPSSWTCNTPKELVDCQDRAALAPAVPWSLDTNLAIGVDLGHDYARINSVGLTADQSITFLKIMLSK